MLLLGKYAKIYILIFNSLPIILRDIQYITIKNNIFFFVLQNLDILPLPPLKPPVGRKEENLFPLDGPRSCGLPT